MTDCETGLLPISSRRPLMSRPIEHRDFLTKGCGTRTADAHTVLSAAVSRAQRLSHGFA